MIEELQKTYNFRLEKKPGVDFAWAIIFSDGREYVFQEPVFFETYEALVSEKPERALFELGLKHLYPVNEKTPKIDELYLRKNKNEAVLLWGRLLPECFFLE